MEDLRKIIITLVSGIILTTIVATAKAIVDVEKLKDKVESMIGMISETRDDIKEIKKYLINKE
jgi:hypothetical protein